MTFNLFDRKDSCKKILWLKIVIDQSLHYRKLFRGRYLENVI